MEGNIIKPSDAKSIALNIQSNNPNGVAISVSNLPPSARPVVSLYLKEILNLNPQNQMTRILSHMVNTGKLPLKTASIFYNKIINALGYPSGKFDYLKDA